jgi:tetratricopeptide (TPR) repeat protein
MGRAFQEKGDLESSLKSYLRAKELNPDLVDLYYSLAMVYGKRGDRCNSHRNFGTYFNKRGEARNALFHFRKALQYCDEKEGIEQKIRRLERALKEETKEM